MESMLYITKGKRCAVALWFTLDPKYVETTFYDAETLIRGIKIWITEDDPDIIGQSNCYYYSYYEVM